MSEDFYPVRASEPEVRERVLSFTGGGTGQPVVNFGKGMTLARVSAGLFTITFAEWSGVFLGLRDESYQSTTMSGLAGFSIVAGAFSGTAGGTATLQFTLYNLSAVATDLTSTQTLTLSAVFKEAGGNAASYAP